MMNTAVFDPPIFQVFDYSNAKRMPILFFFFKSNGLQMLLL